MPAESEILIWKEAFRIPSYAIGCNGQIKFYFIGNFLFDIASTHANHLHWGFDDMQKNNQYWVLSRFHIKMFRYPVMNELIHLETWPKGINRLFAIRDYLISSESGHIICLATSAWLIMDAVTGKPVRISDFRDLFDFNTNKHGIEEVPDKLPPVTEPDYIASIKVSYSDLDINKHVNSGKYIEWIQDSFDDLHYEQQNIKEFQINFMSETHFGETISLKRMPGINEPDCHYFEGIQEGDNVSCFRAKILWDKL
jgi:medium-chain acyl-[acyl-carrier-protein] hydrolase